MFEEEADDAEAGRGGNVELFNDILDEREHVAAGGSDDDVGAFVGLHDERGTALRLGGFRLGAVKGRAEASDLRLQTGAAGSPALR